VTTTRAHTLRLWSVCCVVLAVIPRALPAARPGPDYAPDQLIVRLKPGRAAELKGLNAAVGAQTKRAVEKLRFVSVRLPKGADLQKAAEHYRKSSAVEYVGPNHILHLALMPNDPVFYYGDDFWGIPQWGLYNTVGKPRADIHAPEAWNKTTGSASIIIATIDTGILYDHEDLASKVWVNPREQPYNGIDDDHNGYVDDWHGWNFVSNNNDATDDFYIYHGSLIAGIAAAASNNGIGIAGVSWGSNILPCKVIDADGRGTEDDAAAAVVYAVDMGAKVINMSIEGDDVPALHAAVDYAWERNCICVCASGNENLSTPTYPASYEHALAVGASNEYDQRCTAADWGQGGSNYGSYLDVVAPGSYIVSTGNFLVDFGLAWEPYDTESGTSAAAPFVSGICALVWSVHPDWPNYKVFFQVVHTADDIPPSGFDIYTGWGRANAYKAVTAAIQDAQSPGSVKQLATNASVMLRGQVLSTSSDDLADRLYVQAADRSSGILVYVGSTAAPTDLVVGDMVDVLGTVGSAAGERAILNPIVIKTGTAGKPKPLRMSNRALGGGAYYQQGAVVNRYAYPQKMATGLSNIGLLAKTTGTVTAVASDYFYIDDGSKIRDDTGNTGVRVSFDPDKIARPDTGQYAAITGISSCELVSGSTTIRRRILRPRSQEDIQILRW